jgi:hypothetical protein
MWLKKEDVAGVVILAVVIVAVGLFFFLAPKAPQIVYRPVEETGSSLAVQEPSADNLHTIHVDAVLKVPGFITFHEAMGEAPGALVGTSAYLPAGEYKDFVIELMPGLEPDQQFMSLLFADDGNGRYEAGIDLPVMSEGVVIKAPFITP